MSRTNEIAAVAATVWDQDVKSEADLAFLAVIAAIDKECSETLARSNQQWGVTSQSHQTVKWFVEKRREDGYRKALAALEAAEEADIMGEAMQAAQ